MKREVTAEDILESRRLLEEGKSLRSKCCPIALAAKRAFGKTVYCGRVNLIHSGTISSLPPEAVKFVEQFDLELHVDPFSFEVEA